MNTGQRRSILIPNSNHKDCPPFTFTQPHLKISGSGRNKEPDNLVNIWFFGSNLKFCCSSQFKDIVELPVDGA